MLHLRAIPIMTGTAIVTRSAGLMQPNQYLAVAIDYLYSNRPKWKSDAGVGKTGGQQSDDRPRHRQDGAAVVRGAGGIQMVL